MKTGYKKSKVKESDIAKGYMISEPRPSLSLNDSLLPDIKNWKVDKEYTVTLELKMTGIHKMHNSDKLCGDFDIIKAENEEND